jgi:hypothetical protein
MAAEFSVVAENLAAQRQRAEANVFAVLSLGKGWRVDVP